MKTYLTKEQVESMVESQIALNDLIDPNWREAGHNYYRAVYMEACEAIDSLDWKWWKHTEPDYENVAVEMIDILAFTITHLILSTDDTSVVADAFVDRNEQDEIIDVIEGIVRLSAEASNAFKYNPLTTASVFIIPKVINVWNLLGKTSDDMYRDYITKNWLNIYRQKNGYAKGTYTKVVNGVEDNVHAKMIVDKFNINNYDDFAYYMDDGGYRLIDNS